MAFLFSFNKIVPTLINKFKPDLIITQLCADGYKEDYLGSLRLTINTYYNIGKTPHEIPKIAEILGSFK